MSHDFLSRSEDETMAFAAKLAQSAAAGSIYTLQGDLGAGKTVFAKGFAQGLDFPYPEDVVSPTFTLLQIYEGGRLELYHFDLYRLDDPAEAEEIGMDEYLFGQGVCLIEWAERLGELLPEGAVRVQIGRVPGEGETVRRIRVSGGDAARMDMTAQEDAQAQDDAVAQGKEAVHA